MDQVELKKFYRYCLLREFYYSLPVGSTGIPDTSGYYRKSFIKQLCKDMKLSYSTLRADLPTFEKWGLIMVCNGDHIKFIQLHGRYNNWWKIFRQYREDILNAASPSIYFSDIVKKRTLYYFIQLQAKREAEKIIDPIIKKKYLRLVKSNNSEIGARQGIHLSLVTIGRYLGKTKSTIFKYLERMNATEVLKVIKHVEPICLIQDWNAHYNELYRNRNFSKKGIVYERKLNSYVF